MTLFQSPVRVKTVFPHHDWMELRPIVPFLGNSRLVTEEDGGSGRKGEDEVRDSPEENKDNRDSDA